MFRNTIRTAPLWALLIVAAAPAEVRAQADDTAKVEQLFAEGASLYRAGKYRAAIERFDAAYAIYPEPNLLYNKARAHEALGEIDAALDTYQRCADSPKVDPGVKAKAQGKVKMLEQAKLTTANAPTERRRITSGGSVTRPQPEASGSGLTIAKWGAAGVGGALAIVGAVFYSVGASDHGKVTSASDDAAGGVATLTRAEAQQLSDDGASKKTIGVAMAGAGLAALAGAAVLFVLDGSSDEAAESTVGVGMLPGGAAVTWQGSF